MKVAKGDKICFITPSLHKGGMERVLSELANASTALGYEVHMVCLITKKNIAYKIDDRVRIWEPRFSYSQGLVNKIRVVLYLFKTLRVIKPNVALSFSEIFNPLAILAGLLSGTKIYVSDRSNPLKKFPFFRSLFRAILYPKAAGIIAQTERSKSLAIQKGYNKNIEVIPNPLREIDNTKGVYRSREFKTIISVGRLVPSKNFEELINIFYEIDNPLWNLVIVGDGPHRHQIEHLIARLKLGNKVELTGSIDDIDRLLKKADIFAFTSLSEGFPNALSEALAFPLPCIAYDCPAGPSEMIQNNINGILIPLGNKELFKDRLAALMQSCSLRERLMKKSFNNREKYSLFKITRNYLSFILEKT